MSNKRVLVTAASLSTIALFGVGCGTQGSSGAESPPGPDMHGAPHVQSPIDTTSFQQEPCKSLSPQQIQNIGMGEAAGEADPEATGGPSCEWSNVVSGPSSSMISVTYLAQSNGLKDLYAKRNEYGHFQAIPSVNGYPAVANSSTETPPEQSGRCAVDVGVSDDLTFTTQVNALDGPDKADPCGKAQQVAGEVVKTLQSGK